MEKSWGTFASFFQKQHTMYWTSFKHASNKDGDKIHFNFLIPDRLCSNEGFSTVFKWTTSMSFKSKMCIIWAEVYFSYTYIYIEVCQSIKKEKVREIKKWLDVDSKQCQLLGKATIFLFESIDGSDFYIAYWFVNQRNWKWFHTGWKKQESIPDTRVVHWESLINNLTHVIHSYHCHSIDGGNRKLYNGSFVADWHCVKHSPQHQKKLQKINTTDYFKIQHTSKPQQPHSERQ